MTGPETAPDTAMPLKPAYRFDFFLACLSGVLTTGAFPDQGMAPLAWIALVPLLAAVNGRPPMAGLRLGLAAGFAHYLTLLYWLVYTMNTYGNLPLALCLPVLVLLAVYLSLYTGLFAFGICWLCRSGIRLALLAPALWVALEYLRAVLFTGFPWELLGYAQWKWLPLIQIADITGVYGISFWTVAANAALFLLWSGMAKRPWFEKAVPRVQWVSVAAGVGAVTVALVGYGAWKIGALETRAASAPKIRAAVVQANVDQAVKWKPTFQRATTRRYVALSLEASRQSAQLVVWPETATPFYFERNNAFSTLIRKAIRETGAYFIIGSPAYAAENSAVAYFNSAYLIAPQGDVTGRYDKVHLVPFGEYVPLKQFLPFLGKMVQQVGDFTPGGQGHTLAWKHGPLGIQICYEIVFPHLARSMVKNGAALLVNITNDAWFGHTSAPAQHFSMAVLRAVENRRSVVRSANTGISGFIDPAGRVRGQTRLMEAAVLTRDVPIMSGQSIYTRWGDLFAWLCSAATLLAITATGMRRFLPTGTKS